MISYSSYVRYFADLILKIVDSDSSFSLQINILIFYPINYL